MRVPVAHEQDYDTVCVGATSTSTVAQTFYGSLPQQIGDETDSTVAMVRSEQQAPQTIRKASTQRVDGLPPLTTMSFITEPKGMHSRWYRCA